MANIKDTKPFDFGIASSSYHIEGGNLNSDWAKFEKEFFKDSPENVCGPAVDYWNRWKEDNNYFSDLGITILRTSVEWSRIHIGPDQFDEKALEQYHEMFLDLKRRNIKVVLTLFHYTSPQWFRDIGAFEHKINLRHFGEFVSKTLEVLHDCVDIVTPINEIFVYSSLSYFMGYWIPQKRSLSKFIRVTRNLIRAHFIVASIINDRGYDIKVSSAEHSRNFKYTTDNGLVKKFAQFHNYLFNQAVTKSLVRGKFVFPFGTNERVTKKPYRPLDYLGIQFYPAVKLHVWFKKLTFNIEDYISPITHNGVWTNALLNAKLHPKDFFLTLREYKKYDIPILITESGIQTDDDTVRVKKLTANIRVIKKAIEKGIPVEGYMYFSIFDCFEWAEGYTKKFGLISVDRKNNLERTPKPSFYKYKELIKKFKTLPGQY
jgi:beta-glucosidase